MLGKGKIKIAIIPLVIIGIISIFYMRESEKEKKYIVEYLDLYYFQLKIPEREKENIESSIVASSHNGENQVKYNLNKIQFYNQFKKYLSDEYLEFMFNSNELPNYNLIDYGIKEHVKSYHIENVKYKKNVGGVNQIAYDVLIKSADDRLKILRNDQLVTFIKKDGKLIINNITDNFGK